MINDNGGFEEVEKDRYGNGTITVDQKTHKFCPSEIEKLKGLNKIKDIAKLEEKEAIKGLRMLREQKNKNVMDAFVTYALKNTVPYQIWVGSKSEICVRKIFSIYDEAFALLVIMNNWKEWEYLIGLGKDIRKDRRESRTLFTNKYIDIVEDGDGRGIRAGINYGKKKKIQIKGWNEDGIEEYNNILRYLSTVRNDVDHIEVEEQLLARYKEEDKLQLGKRKRACNEVEALTKKVKPFDAYNMPFVQM